MNYGWKAKKFALNIQGLAILDFFKTGICIPTKLLRSLSILRTSVSTLRLSFCIKIAAPPSRGRAAILFINLIADARILLQIQVF